MSENRKRILLFLFGILLIIAVVVIALEFGGVL